MVVAAVVLASGVAAHWLAWRLRVPAIVFLLGAGLVAGPLTGVLDPDEVFGDLLFPLVSVAVAIILFEGSLGLGWRGVRAAGSTVWALLSVGAAVTVGVSMVAARVLLDVEWQLAALLAAVLVVTGPTVIGPIVRAIGLRGRLGAILEAEGTLIDPIGAIMAVLVYEGVYAAEEGGADIANALLATLATGAVVGLAAALLLAVALARYVIPDELHSATTLAAVVTAFAVSNEIRPESGLVAATVMGVALASQPEARVHHVLAFNVTLRIMLISALFILLGARIETNTLREVEWRNMAFLAVLVVVGRPLSVFIATIRSELTWRERAFLAATAPRGIVAAAVASVFALQLAQLEVENSQVLVSATFTVIAGTVLLSGLGSRALATKLGLIDPKADATVIVLGANPLARTVGRALEQHGAPVRLIDIDRRELQTARMGGLDVHRGSVVAEGTWEGAGVHAAGRFIAMAASDELNALAARRAAEVIDRRNVYALAPRRPEHQGRWRQPPASVARMLFSESATYDHLSKLIEDGWQVSSTNITEKFGLDDHARVHPGAIPLFVVDTRGRIDLLVLDHRRRRPGPGDKLVALTEPDDKGG